MIRALGLFIKTGYNIIIHPLSMYHGVWFRIAVLEGAQLAVTAASGTLFHSQ